MSSPNTPTSQMHSDTPFYSSAENTPDFDYLGFTPNECTTPSPSFTATFTSAPAKPPSNRGAHWKAPEDLALCKAWLKIGTDGIVSNEQKGDDFYIRILAELCRTYKVPEGRTHKAVKTHWNLIRNNVSSYIAILHKVMSIPRSGYSDENYVSFFISITFIYLIFCVRYFFKL